MMNAELVFKLPSIPSEPGPEMAITVTVKVGEGDSCLTIEQTNGPQVLVENQKGHLVVYVWKSAEAKDTGDNPVKVECE